MVIGLSVPASAVAESSTVHPATAGQTVTLSPGQIVLQALGCFDPGDSNEIYHMTANGVGPLDGGWGGSAGFNLLVVPSTVLPPTTTSIEFAYTFSAFQVASGTITIILSP